MNDVLVLDQVERNIANLVLFQSLLPHAKLATIDLEKETCTVEQWSWNRGWTRLWQGLGQQTCTFLKHLLKNIALTDAVLASNNNNNPSGSKRSEQILQLCKSLYFLKILQNSYGSFPELEAVVNDFYKLSERLNELCPQAIAEDKPATTEEEEAQKMESVVNTPEQSYQHNTNGSGLSEPCELGQAADLFVQTQSRFGEEEDDDADIILITPPPVTPVRFVDNPLSFAHSESTQTNATIQQSETKPTSTGTEPLTPETLIALTPPQHPTSVIPFGTAELSGVEKLAEKHNENQIARPTNPDDEENKHNKSKTDEQEKEHEEEKEKEKKQQKEKEEKEKKEREEEKEKEKENEKEKKQQEQDEKEKKDRQDEKEKQKQKEKEEQNEKEKKERQEENEK